MKYCILCRQAFLEPDFFCPTHGLRLRTAEADHVKQCLGCGSIIERGEKFCRRCGFDVTDVDWPTGADQAEARTNPKDERPQQRSGDEVAGWESDELRLRPFRQTRARPVRGSRVRRRRVGVLLVAIMISVSLVAWHAFDLRGWSLVEQLNAFPFRTTAPGAPDEFEHRTVPHGETSLSGASQLPRPTDGEAARQRTENALLEPGAVRSETPEEAPSLVPGEPTLGDTTQMSEPSESAQVEAYSNSGRQAAKQSEKIEAPHSSRPAVRESARAPSPSPEEAQRQREAERRRVQREVEEAIAIRGVSGVAVSFINGTVFLGGEVQTVSQRKAAEQAARRIPDVKDVRSRISVKWADQG